MSSTTLKGYTWEEFERLASDEDKDIIYGYFNQLFIKDTSMKQYESSILIFFKWYRENYYVAHHKRTETMTDGSNIVDPNKNLERFLEGKGCIAMLQPRHAQWYHEFLIDNGLSNYSIEFKRRTLSSLYNYIVEVWQDEYPMARNIFKKDVIKLKPIPIKKIEKKLTSRDIDKINKYLISKNQLQKLAFFHFVRDTGCAREDIASLKINDLVDGIYWVERDNKIFRYEFSQETVNYINMWLNKRKKIIEKDISPYVFIKVVSGESQSLYNQTFSRWFKEISEIIDKKITFTTFRKTSVKSYADMDFNIRIEE